MTAPRMKQPGPDHPITIAPHGERVVVIVAGKVVADSRRALELRESSYPPILYIPREDADLALLQKSDHATFCPYKGDCAYYSIPAGGDRSIDAVWSYEEPYDAVSAIRGHFAFYPNRVDAIANRPAD